MAKDYMDMSEEEFLNAPPPEAEDTNQSSEANLTQENTDDINQNQNTDVSTGSNSVENNSTEEPDNPTSESEVTEESTPEVTNTGSDKDNQSNSEKPETGNQETESTTSDAEKLSWYEKLSKPFRADNKDFTVKSPEQLIALAQKGINYNTKMHSLANDRKLAEILKQNNLTNPEDIGFLLDLRNGNKEAIKKLLADKKINPSDLDMNEDDDGNLVAPQEYRAPVPAEVSDQYLTVKDHIENIQALEGGAETVNTILGYDEVTKNYLFQNPWIMDTLHQHRTETMPSGQSRYQEVVDEIQREKALGTIPYDMPFLQAYKTAGDALWGAPEARQAPAKNAYLGSNLGSAVAKPKAKPNLAQAGKPAKANTKSTPRKDYLNMSEAEFMAAPPPD